MYLSDVDLTIVRLALPTQVVDFIREGNNTEIPLEQILACMLIEKVNDIVLTAKESDDSDESDEIKLKGAN